MTNGARSDHSATRPPTAGPAMAPTRNPPLNRPVARPRCPPGTVASSSVWAPTVYIAEPSPPAPRRTISCANDPDNPASTLLTATTAIPVNMMARSPNRFTSRPAGSAPASRTSANTLITLAAAAVLTPNWRANCGMAGAAIPYPSATVNATAVRPATSGGSPRKPSRACRAAISGPAAGPAKSRRGSPAGRRAH